MLVKGYKHDDNGVFQMHLNEEGLARTLPAGIYIPRMNVRGPFYVPLDWNSDDLFDFSSGPTVDAMNEITTFWDKKETFKAIK